MIPLFYVWLLSFNIVSMRTIHVVICLFLHCCILLYEYPAIDSSFHSRTFRLFPFWGCYKYSCYNLLETFAHKSFDRHKHSLLCGITELKDIAMFSSRQILPNNFLSTIYTPVRQYRSSNYATSLPTLDTGHCWSFNQSDRSLIYMIFILICISMMTDEVDHQLVFNLAMWISFLR